MGSTFWILPGKEFRKSLGLNPRLRLSSPCQECIDHNFAVTLEQTEGCCLAKLCSRDVSDSGFGAMEYLGLWRFATQDFGLWRFRVQGNARNPINPKMPFEPQSPCRNITLFATVGLERLSVNMSGQPTI